MTHFSLFKKPLQITLSFWLREILLFYNNYRVSSTVTISSYSLESQNACHDGVVKRICMPRSRVASAVLRYQTTEFPQQDARAGPQARGTSSSLGLLHTAFNHFLPLGFILHPIWASLSLRRNILSVYLSCHHWYLCSSFSHFVLKISHHLLLVS